MENKMEGKEKTRNKIEVQSKAENQDKKFQNKTEDEKIQDKAEDEKIQDKIENKKIKTRQERAVEYFKSGYNCSQSVFAAFYDKYNMDIETALRISASFGGGMGRMREVCGAVSGMLLVAGMETGAVKGKDIEGKKHNYDIVQQLAREYKKLNGSIICRELLGLSKDGVKIDTTDTRPEERTEEYYKKRPCIQLIEQAVTIAENILNI